ncbi:uncharacterized protein BO72DRAFT_48131 [Aspergillus fijiensis CBS 313.89]|uniref:Uncharacterized protein n=1 Tax=Aspergillus fijiensis CBS 313.89 TaxID=1448319 RepID=A0A8G1VT98_9EURO|nr:uncharacterized protein BO72DRAFT_48131 [Aspergillus fijiensis CBS 313.89]RAK70861.1 hypothetical protein BO72DRAFT_48131 [Aspergillus fijiensis CBS 313.89]
MRRLYILGSRSLWSCSSQGEGDTRRSFPEYLLYGLLPPVSLSLSLSPGDTRWLHISLTSYFTLFSDYVNYLFGGDPVQIKKGGTCRRHQQLIEICLRISTVTESIIRPRYCIRSDFPSPRRPLRSWSSPKLDLSPTLLGSCFMFKISAFGRKPPRNIVGCTCPSPFWENVHLRDSLGGEIALPWIDPSPESVHAYLT